MTPTSFKPERASDFIGAAGIHAHMLHRKIEQNRDNPAFFFRALFYGPPGCGKSELAWHIAITLAKVRCYIEDLNGQSMSVDLVREWRRQSHYRPLPGEFRCRIVDEFDMASTAAHAELLSFLDMRTPQTCFIATTNQTVDRLLERLQTRMQLYKFTPVEDQQLAAWLNQRWQIPFPDAEHIALANHGNVRGALNDAETWLDRQQLVEVAV